MRRASFHYPQFCALARALEILGERWTLLVVRELLLGPKRFSDLLERLPNISPSVLMNRLARAEASGLIRRSRLGAPVRATVYELTDLGARLRPAVFELIKWGSNFLSPQRLDDQFEPDWLGLVFSAYARKGASPARRFGVRVRTGRKEALLYLSGGPNGTVVHDRPVPTDAIITASPVELLGMMSGRVDPLTAIRAGRARAEGHTESLKELPQLFEIRRPETTGH